MGKKYYDILGILDNATETDIKRAYKKMALIYHPDKNKAPDAETKFKELTQAYDVLTDKSKKEKYDKYGDNPVPEQQYPSAAHQQYPTAHQHYPSAHFNATFNFGTAVPNLFQYSFTKAPGKAHQKQQHRPSAQCFPKKYPPPPPAPPVEKRKDPPIVHDLFISLEDVLIGCTKKMKIERSILNPVTRVMDRETKVLSINVKPGWKEGTKITFKEEGDFNGDNIPADIVFILKDKEHSSFSRTGNDLIYHAPISLKEALCGTTVQIPTLTGETIPLEVSDVVSPKTEHFFAGHGLPIPKDRNKRGALIVKFDIEFPKQLSSQTKKMLSEMLPS